MDIVVKTILAGDNEIAVFFVKYNDSHRRTEKDSKVGVEKLTSCQTFRYLLEIYSENFASLVSTGTTNHGTQTKNI